MRLAVSTRTLRAHALIWSVAAIPYLLLSSSQQAGLVTHVSPDGSGERLAYARTAAGRQREALKHLGQTLPVSDIRRAATEADGQRMLVWLDAHVADLSRLGEIETSHEGILQQPLSIYTRHTWKETVAFDRGDATEVEVVGKGLAELHYVVRMPGRITATTPPGAVDESKVEWMVRVTPTPQTFTAESVSVRWAYLLLWLYVLAFLITKAIVYGPRVAKRIRRRPRKI